MKKFKLIYVEITNICNLNCSFCPKNSRPKKFMTVDEFDKITDEIAPLTNTICLHLMGEPLLHPQIKEIFEICNKKNLKVYLTTNGTLIKQNLELLKTGCAKRISVSLHSFEANDNCDSLDNYLENTIYSCKEINENSQACIEFRLWNESIDKNAKNLLNKKIIEKINKTFNTNLSNLNLQQHANINKTTKMVQLLVYKACLLGEIQEVPAGMFADSGCYPTVYTMGDEIVISDLKDCKINDNLSYEFKGWYLDSNCTIPLVDNTISDQMEVSVLYAKLAMWVKG